MGVFLSTRWQALDSPFGDHAKGESETRACQHKNQLRGDGDQMKRRREVTIEFEREIVISNHHGQAAWCAFCGSQVQMLTADEAAQIKGTGTNQILAAIDAGRLHYQATEDGQIWICADSLMASNAAGRDLSAEVLRITEGMRLTDDNLIDTPTT